MGRRRTINRVNICSLPFLEKTSAKKGREEKGRRSPFLPGVERKEGSVQ